MISYQWEARVLWHSRWVQRRGEEQSYWYHFTWNSRKSWRSPFQKLPVSPWTILRNWITSWRGKRITLIHTEIMIVNCTKRWYYFAVILCYLNKFLISLDLAHCPSAKGKDFLKPNKVHTEPRQCTQAGHSCEHLSCALKQARKYLHNATTSQLPVQTARTV